MEKTGLIVDLLAFAEVDWQNDKLMEQSEQYQQVIIGIANILDTFKEIGQSRDLDLIILAEEMMVFRERESYGQEDTSVLPSLTAAVADFEVIKSSIQTVKSPVAYQTAATTYHAKKKLKGVIADGCHEALNSHITRLGNRVSAVGISIQRKNVLRQRQSNMRVAKELYMELQHKALG